MSEAMKHIPVGSIASIADAVAHIHLLRDLNEQGINITPAMNFTLNRIDVLPNTAAPDVIGLVELATILVNNLALSADPVAAQAAAYLNRALPELHVPAPPFWGAASNLRQTGRELARHGRQLRAGYDQYSNSIAGDRGGAWPVPRSSFRRFSIRIGSTIWAHRGVDHEHRANPASSRKT